MTTTVDTNTLLVNDAAISTLAKMREQVVAATEFWKHPKHDDDGYALKMAVSLGRQLAMMMESGWGRDVKVFRDGELSLYITTPTIVYGMIFHPHGRPDAPKDDDVRIFFGTAPVLGRYCMGRQNRGMRGTEP